MTTFFINKHFIYGYGHIILRVRMRINEIIYSIKSTHAAFTGNCHQQQQPAPFYA